MVLMGNFFVLTAFCKHGIVKALLTQSPCPLTKRVNTANEKYYPVDARLLSVPGTLLSVLQTLTAL